MPNIGDKGNKRLRQFKDQLEHKETFNAMTNAAKWNLIRRVLLLLVRRALVNGGS